MKKIIKPLLVGIVSGALLLLLYFLVMFVTKNSFSSAINQLEALKFWVIPLVATFGVQVGLFVYVKDCGKQVGSTTTATGATTSSVAMIACCAHHVTDILPIVGLSLVATALSRYQEWFLALGVLSNITGIIIMIREIRKMR